MAATRLPGKPLLKIYGKSIISQVYKKALETNIGETYVATEDQEIFEDVVKNGGKCVMTQKDHKTGTDRIFEAYQKIDTPGVKYILNVQGDEPLIDTNDIVNLNSQITKSNSDMGTLACKINDENQYYDIIFGLKVKLNQLDKIKDYFNHFEMDGYGLFIKSLFGDSHSSLQELNYKELLKDKYYKWDENGQVISTQS